MRGTRTLQIVSDSLGAIDLPTLHRPSVKPHEPKTKDLVQWGTCVYVYSVIAHMKKVLAGLLQLAEAKTLCIRPCLPSRV